MPEVQEAIPVKYKVLRDELLRAIRSGEFAAGDRLPAERTLAAQFGVSHMTARQAVSDLVEFELLERRSREGIFVREHSQEKLSTVTLNLICPVEDSSWITEFIRFGMQQCAQRGWRARITRTHLGYERPIVRAVAAGEPSLVMLDLPILSKTLHEAMVKSGGTAVLIGNRSKHPRVPSVLADDRTAIKMALEHLGEHGHHKIGLLTHDVEHPVVVSQIETWREYYHGTAEASKLNKRFIHAPIPEFQSGAAAHYDAVKSYLASPDADITALICLDNTAALGAFGACRAMGLSVPNDLSLISTLDDEVMQYINPAITVIDVDGESHVKYGLELIDAALAGTLCEENRVRLVQPLLLPRESVRNLNARP
jgi:DNA-binding LacI/PurR family transcriptional regulator